VEGKLHEEIRKALKITECEEEVLYIISPESILRIVDKIKKTFPFFPKGIKEPKTELDKKHFTYHVYRTYRKQVWEWFIENFGSTENEKKV